VAARSDGVVCLRQTITGLGGVGKTQIATEYAYRFGSEYEDAIWWINAEKSPMEDLFEFVERFNILVSDGIDAERQMGDDGFIRTLNAWFENHSSFLLIFDNVDFDNAEASKIAIDLVSRVRAGHVLITTCCRKLNLSNINPK